MFANHYTEDILKELTKCLRVFPHDQNTSGFFITIIRKIKEFDSQDQQTEKEPKVEENKKEAVSTKQNSLMIQAKDKRKTF